MNRLTDILHSALPLLEKGIAVENTGHEILQKIQWAIKFFEDSPITVHVPGQPVTPPQK